MKEIRYEIEQSKIDYNRLPTIFLAGPTVRGHQTQLESWRNEAINILKDKKFDGNVIIPEFTVSTISDKYRYDLPEWEFEGLSNSDVIIFWVCRTRELAGLTTNHELGYWMAKDRHKIVYGRPDDAYRTMYDDIMWNLDGRKNHPELKQHFPIYNTLEKTVNAALYLLAKKMRDKDISASIYNADD